MCSCVDVCPVRVRVCPVRVCPVRVCPVRVCPVRVRALCTVQLHGQDGGASQHFRCFEDCGRRSFVAASPRAVRSNTRITNHTTTQRIRLFPRLR